MSRPIALAALLVLAACSTKPQEPPVVVLVTVDTLRREHVGCYGYFRDTTPNIDAIAEEGVVYERAVATMASTLPSHLSLLTGLYPHQHGILANKDAGKKRFTQARGRRSAAFLLRRSGYHTAAFVSAPVVGLHTGIGVGFKTFWPKGMWRRAMTAEETASAAIRWLDHAQAPFFLWLHFWEPHEPNEPPEPFASEFRGKDREQIARELAKRGASIAEHWVKGETLERFFLDGADRARERLAGGEHVDPEQLFDLFDRYDGDVRCTDYWIGQLVDALKEKGVWERAIFVFTADHGQAFGEHGWLGHGEITNENVYVPLVMRFPPDAGVPPHRESRVVSMVDVMPTILARLDAERGHELLEQAEGVDLLSPSRREYAFAQRTDRALPVDDNGLKCALVTDRWKYVHRQNGGEELFDLSADLLEEHDVRADHPEVASRLLDTILEILASRSAVLEDAGRTPEEERQILDALDDFGYGGDDE